MFKAPDWDLDLGLTPAFVTDSLLGKLLPQFPASAVGY